MWRITEWNKTPKHYDFSGAGLSKVDVTAVESDEVELCNGIELCDWEEDDDRMQLIVCEACGIPGCETGGWTTFRKADDLVFWIPLFDELLSGDDGSLTNYSPPDYFRTRGIPYFRASDYSRFQGEFPRFPSLAYIEPLSVGEAMRCFQHDAPCRLLGDLYHGQEAQQRMSLVLAATEGDHQTWCRILATGFGADCADKTPAQLTAPQPDDRALTMFPDIPKCPDWHVLWLGADPGYYLAPDLKLQTQTIAKTLQATAAPPRS